MSQPFDRALRRAVGRLTEANGPPRLAAAIRAAVFGDAHRLRPRLCYAVADAIGGMSPALTDGAAVALEFLHCASLVQDDLPSFDDAMTRRGRPAVHRQYGDALAILVADALIVGAFEELAAAAGSQPLRGLTLIRLLARAVAPPHGAVAGQAWELEASADVERYHQGKTAALFEAATMAGAVGAGVPHEPWRVVGYHIGMAYQLADDVADATEDKGSRAAATAVTVWSAHERQRRWSNHARQAVALVPPCRGRESMRDTIETLMTMFRARRSPSNAAPPAVADVVS